MVSINLTENQFRGLQRFGYCSIEMDAKSWTEKRRGEEVELKRQGVISHFCLVLFVQASENKNKNIVGFRIKTTPGAEP